MKVQELATLMTRRFDDVDHRLERVETGLVTMNGAMTSVRADLTLLRRDVQMLDGRMVKVEGDIRATNVAIEELRDVMKSWAEGLDTVRERVDRHKIENDEQFEQIRSVLTRR